MNHEQLEIIKQGATAWRQAADILNQYADIRLLNDAKCVAHRAQTIVERTLNARK
jgi:hypothetical protein